MKHVASKPSACCFGTVILMLAWVSSLSVANTTSDETSTTEPTTAARPLMLGLQNLGVGEWMTHNRIDAFGWIEGSYNYNFDNPSPRLNLGHLFDAQDSDIVVNQLQVNIERPVQLGLAQFDIGGRIDLLYGSDARFLHSSGMLTGSFPDPQYQFDIPQAYVDLAIPAGNGLRLRVGKFEFFKFTDPNASPLFSHTFFYAASGEANGSRLASTQVGASLPFTMTGITVYYEFDKALNLEVGLGRGYDQTFTDNNSAIDGFGRVNWTISAQTQASFAIITGPEISGDESHYRTSLDLGIVHAITGKLFVLGDACYGQQQRGQTLVVPGQGSFSIGGTARWYGLNVTGIYRFDRYISAALRGEWYRDEEGFTTDLGGANLYEITAGLTISPWPDDELARGLKFRPEIRYDVIQSHSTFSRLIPNHQWIFSADLIYNF